LVFKVRRGKRSGKREGRNPGTGGGGFDSEKKVVLSIGESKVCGWSTAWEDRGGKLQTPIETKRLSPKGYPILRKTVGNKKSKKRVSLFL